MFFINRQSDWLQKLFGVRRRPQDPDQPPDRVMTAIRPTVDGVGWLDMERLVHEEFLGGVGVVTLQLPVVPEGEFWLYVEADGHYRLNPGPDTGPHNLWWERNTGGAGANNAAITVNRSALAGQGGTTIARLEIIVPGDRLQLRADAMGGGEELRARTNRIVLAPGAYIPHLTR